MTWMKLDHALAERDAWEEMALARADLVMHLSEHGVDERVPDALTQRLCAAQDVLNTLQAEDPWAD